MKNSLKLFKLFGIDVEIHISFFLLLFFFFYMAQFRGIFFIIIVFSFVVAHEMCHSLQAKRFGIFVKSITLLPIGGLAQMQRMPSKPSEEFAISIAGPLFNIILAIILYFPLKSWLGNEIFSSPSLESWPQTFAYIFWINPILAIFNLLPAFPMDGGRILRSLLARKLGLERATQVAVGFGHLFAILFAFVGLVVQFNIFLLLIAFFIYIAASQEGLQVKIRSTLDSFKAKDVISRNMITLTKDTPISQVLNLIFHYHQEDFPVVEEGKLIGFMFRNDVISALHRGEKNAKVSDIMRNNFPVAKLNETLASVYNKLQSNNLKALPVVEGEQLYGIVSVEDISRVYSLLKEQQT
jgi:Zn-dependent protease